MEFLGISRRLTDHDLCFAVFSTVSLVLFRKYLEALARLSVGDAKYSHLVFIPVMSAVLIYLQRAKIFSGPRYCLLNSLPFLVAGIVLFYFIRNRSATVNYEGRLSIAVVAIITVWMAGFVLCYGTESFKAALFPWLFLFLTVPVPTALLDHVVLALQAGSAVITYSLFKVLRVPVLWNHFKFLLPGVEIEIAAECSGIRSSMALLITSILTGYLFLVSNWRRAFFSLLTIPVVIFKNAVRIVTISCLGVYVDPGFLQGRLHRYGGLPFSLLSLAILVPILLVLQKGERPRRPSPRSVLATSGTNLPSDCAVLNSALD